MAKSWAGFDVVLLIGQPVKTALESQEAWIARLRRQREIIKAYRAGLSRPPGPELYPGHAGPRLLDVWQELAKGASASCN